MGVSKETRGNVHDLYEIKTNSDKVKKYKEEGKSCRTCRYFYMRKLPRTYDPDVNHARCSLKGNKEVRHYNICEHHQKLVVQIVPLDTKEN